MLKETYVANVKRVKLLDPTAYFEYVNNYTLLAPSKAMKIRAGVMKDPKTGEKRKPKMPFEEYKALYIKELQDPRKRMQMGILARLAQTKDVYLVCYEKDSSKCHRTILLEEIQKLDFTKILSGILANHKTLFDYMEKE